VIGTPEAAYATVFAFEALLFVAAALLAASLGRTHTANAPPAGVTLAGLQAR
jgi:hypothetical protein